MINGFKFETHELNEYEFNYLLPLIVKGLKPKIGKANIVTSNYIINALKRKYNAKISGARFRKLMHFIQVESLIPYIVATNKGYYIATSEKELLDYEESLVQRAESILEKAKAVAYQRRQKYGSNGIFHFGRLKDLFDFS